MRGNNEASLRELIARLVDSAKAFAQAEIALVRKTVSAWAGAAAIGAALTVTALLLVGAAIVVLVAALGMTLAMWIGVPGGLAVAGLIALASAGLLAWLAVRRFTTMVK